MGGIHGFYGAQFEENGTVLLDKMADAMQFRGQSRDRIQDVSVFLGTVSHDYEVGKRVVNNSERSVIAVCEGEIYNASELLGSLKNSPQSGKGFNGFELIPYLYQEQGKDFARAINGVFGIALWDNRNKSLLLVRDHLGSHSIYYSFLNHSFAFATTVKALFCADFIAPEIDVDSLDRYFASLAISPPGTIFEKVRSVRPGYCVILHDNQVTEYSYWPIDLFQENYETSFQEFANQLRSIFEDAVSIRAAHGDQRIGALVSGGVDTSSVVAVLSKKEHIAKYQGFSIAFDERAFNDASLQEIIYKKFNLKPNQIVLKPKEFADGLARGSAFLDCPVNDVAYSGMFNAFRIASEYGCNIVFEGEGSDEIFCTGHSQGEFDIQKYLTVPYALRRLFFGMFIPLFSEKSTLIHKIFRMLARLGMTDLKRRSTWIPVFSQNTRNRLLGRKQAQACDILKTAREYYGKTQLRDMLNIYQYGLTRLFLPNDLLFKNERMASAHAITNRTPFIDYRLVEKAFQIPAKYKIQKPNAHSDGTKMIFKTAVHGLVPDEILDRKKTRGFSQPTAVWYRNDLKDFVYDHLFAGNPKIYDWLDKKVTHQIYEDFMTGKASNDYFLNSLLILELWMQNYL